MAVYEIRDMRIIDHLFAGRQESFVRACLAGCMGTAYADDAQNPKSAAIALGDFRSFAGVPSSELVRCKPVGPESDFMLLAPPDEAWALAIERAYGQSAQPHTRFSTKRAQFDDDKLRGIVARLAAPYELRAVDEALYHQILRQPWCKDQCSSYPSFADYRANGLGVAILLDGEIVSGASSYIHYPGGIEVQIDTREDQRSKGLALASGAALILRCQARGLYPSWDAHDKRSLALAEKLGYALDREYLAYLVDQSSLAIPPRS